VFLDQRLTKKVPELTIYFWVIKVLTTGMGETTSDFFVHRYNPYIGAVLWAAILAVTMIWLSCVASGRLIMSITQRGETIETTL